MTSLEGRPTRGGRGVEGVVRGVTLIGRLVGFMGFLYCCGGYSAIVY